MQTVRLDTHPSISLSQDLGEVRPWTALRYRLRMPIKNADRTPPIIDFPRSFAGRLWELQFELSSRPRGAFAALTDSAYSSAKLQVPGTLSATVVKWPVELAQDDSWRMESGTGSGFVWNWGGCSLWGIESATRNGCRVMARELGVPKGLVP